MAAELVPTFSEAQVVERLTPVVAAGGSLRIAVRNLQARGVDTSYAELKALREDHSGMYLALAADYSRAVEDQVAQEYREILVGTTHLTKDVIEALQGEMDDYHRQVEAAEADPTVERPVLQNPERLVMAMSKVLSTSTDKLLSITGRPVGGQATDPMEAARELVRLGVLKPVEGGAEDAPSIDSTATEDPAP